MTSRRQFIKTTASALALASLPHPCVAAPFLPLDLGFSLYGMKSLPLDEALQACAEIGYRNVEFAALPGFPTEPKRLSPADRKKIRARLRSLNLRLSALMLNLSLAADATAQSANRAALRETAALARDLAPETAPLLQTALIETVLGGKPGEWENIRSTMLENLKSWMAELESSQVTLAIKAHVGSAVNSPARLLWLLEQVNHPLLKAAFDYSHFQLMGEPLRQSLLTLLPRSRFIHIKDSTGDLKKFQFLLPGEGTIDYPAYFQLLHQHHYQGPVVVEVSAQISSKPGYDPVAAAKKAHTHLAAALQKATPTS